MNFAPGRGGREGAAEVPSVDVAAEKEEGPGGGGASGTIQVREVHLRPIVCVAGAVCLCV